jgi:hypothetical protein
MSANIPRWLILTRLCLIAGVLLLAASNVHHRVELAAMEERLQAVESANQALADQVLMVSTNLLTLTMQVERGLKLLP